MYSNEIQLIKKKKKNIVYPTGPIPREDTGGWISHRSFLEFGGDGRWIRSNEGLSNVVPDKRLMCEEIKSNCIDESAKPVFLRSCEKVNKMRVT